MNQCMIEFFPTKLTNLTGGETAPMIFDAIKICSISRPVITAVHTRGYISCSCACVEILRCMRSIAELLDYTFIEQDRFIVDDFRIFDKPMEYDIV